MISLLESFSQELLNWADSAIHSSLYTTQGMYDNAKRWFRLQSQVNSNIQNSSSPKLLLFSISHPSSKERISGFSSNLHPRCFDGFQRSDWLPKSYTTILGSILDPRSIRRVVGNGWWLQRTNIPSGLSEFCEQRQVDGEGTMQVKLKEKSFPGGRSRVLLSNGEGWYQESPRTWEMQALDGEPSTGYVFECRLIPLN